MNLPNIMLIKSCEQGLLCLKKYESIVGELREKCIFAHVAKIYLIFCL